MALDEALPVSYLVFCICFHSWCLWLNLIVSDIQGSCKTAVKFILHWIKAPLTFDVILFKDPYELVPQQTAVGPHKNMVKTIDYKNNIMNVSMQHKKKITFGYWD